MVLLLGWTVAAEVQLEVRLAILVRQPLERLGWDAVGGDETGFVEPTLFRSLESRVAELHVALAVRPLHVVEEVQADPATYVGQALIEHEAVVRDERLSRHLHLRSTWAHDRLPGLR